MNNIASRPLLDGKDLDMAIMHARATLEALLRAPGGGPEYPKMLVEARALLGTLLDLRVALAAARLDQRDADAVAATRADRNKAIAVTGALLYWLPAGDGACPQDARAMMTWVSGCSPSPTPVASADPACWTCWNWSCSTARSR